MGVLQGPGWAATIAVAMRRYPAVAFLLAGCVAALSPALPADAPGASGGAVPGAALRLTLNGRKALVSSLDADGRTFVSMTGVAAALGAKVDRGRRTGDLVVKGTAGILDFSSERPALVLVRAAAGAPPRGLSLASEARAAGADLYVPLDSVTQIVSALTGEAAAAASPRDQTGAPAGAAVGFALLGGEGFMRLVVEPRQTVPWTLDQTTTDVTLRLRGQPGSAPWAARPVGSPILDRVRFEETPDGGLRVRLDPGPGFERATAVALEKPFRVVVEMRGRSEARTMTASAGPGGAVPSPAAGLRTVVLDPGHGGTENGAEAPGGLLEKEITLDVAARLAALLRTAGLRVVLTRESDMDLDLVGRTAIANRERADLFMSIHANASPRKDARGAETYYLSYQTGDADARALASSENAGAPLETGGPDGALDLVLWDLAQADHLRESGRLAEIVQTELNGALGLADRGVKQAPFRVLMGARMPAVLVEIGFLTHPVEGSALATPETRESLAGALSRAVLSFKTTFDRMQGAGAP